MLLGHDTGEPPREAHLRRWFLVAGGVGVAVALLLAVALRFDVVSSGLVVTLWPSSMVQLIDPQTVGSNIAVGLIAYGSNFIIYGLVGMGIGLVTNRVMDLRERR